MAGLPIVVTTENAPGRHEKRKLSQPGSSAFQKRKSGHFASESQETSGP
jgi:hypothetical protein